MIKYFSGDLIGHSTHLVCTTMQMEKRVRRLPIGAGIEASTARFAATTQSHNNKTNNCYYAGYSGTVPPPPSELKRRPVFDSKKNGKEPKNLTIRVHHAGHHGVQPTGSDGAPPRLRRARYWLGPNKLPSVCCSA
jgi:hypothetical protein